MVGTSQGDYTIYSLARFHTLHKGYLLRANSAIKFIDLNHTTGDLLIGSETEVGILSSNGVLLASYHASASTIKSAILKSSIEQHDDNLLILGLSNNEVQFYAMRPLSL